MVIAHVNALKLHITILEIPHLVDPVYNDHLYYVYNKHYLKTSGKYFEFYIFFKRRYILQWLLHRWNDVVTGKKTHRQPMSTLNEKQKNKVDPSTV